MTLEEKAYEYAKYNDNGRVSVNDDKFKAYIAGATENGVVWHDLQKNSDDLPKTNHYVILYNRETGYEIARKPPYEEYYDDLWITKDNRSIRAKDAVLWAEIPSFKVAT